jgi:hypothetical protein
MGPDSGFDKFMPPECIEAGITDMKDCKVMMFTLNMPPECQKAGVSTPEECEKYMEQKYMPSECKRQGFTNMKECEQYLMKKHLPPECKQAGIDDMKECEKYLTNMYAPKICRDKGATNKAECERLVFQEYGRPDECKGLIDAECRRLIEEGKIQASDLMEKLNSDLPPKCIELGAKTFQECDRLAMEKNIPPECKEAGAFTRRACEKVMMEKFGPGPDMMPRECQEAGITDPRECKKLMHARYFPQECKEAGIVDDEECKKFIARKHLPLECIEKGITAKEECEEVLREEVMAPECKEQGIFDEAACKQYMMEKYAKKVKCEGISDDECRIAISKRHLGQIVKKQKEFKEIKEGLDSVIGKHLDLGHEFLGLPAIQPPAGPLAEEEVPVSPPEGETQPPATVVSRQAEKLKEILPVVLTAGISLLVVPTNEEAIISEDESIIQTLPAAVMFDDDADGIPNDIEERIGTDPKSADSDGDGHNDAIEVTGGFDPLGEGRARFDLAPVEQAIMGQKSLGQPLIEGEVLKEEFVVSGGEVIEPNGRVLPLPTSAEQPATAPEPEPAPVPEPAPAEPTSEPTAPIIGPEPPPEAPPAEEPSAWLPRWLQNLIKPALAKTSAQLSQKIILKGKATPNTVVTLYIYSELPIIATTETDENGNWNYTIDKPLADGEHKVYVALPDANGNITKKSPPFSFFISKARAVTPQQFAKEIADVIPKASIWQRWLWLWVLAAVLILAALIFAGIYVFRKKNVDGSPLNVFKRK